ncbi:hypothetical protein GTY54_01805, partial [Streptomyces sp. SID625]|nr:hypothetical protein [Streptomyces sp. SID625]
DMQVGAPHSVTVGKLREQARELGVDQAVDVIVLAGRLYVGHCREIWPHAQAPLLGMGIGHQKQMLARIQRAGCPHPDCLEDGCTPERPCCPGRGCVCPRAGVCPVEPAGYDDDGSVRMFCQAHRAEFTRS